MESLPVDLLSFPGISNFGGEKFFRGVDHENDFLDQLVDYADTVSETKLRHLQDSKEIPLVTSERSSRQRRSISDAEATFDLLKADFLELGEVEEILSIPVDYPNDVESLYYGEDFYILITHASDTANPSFCDTIHLYKSNFETFEPELILTQDAPGVKDLDFFIFEENCYVVVAQEGDGSSRSEGILVYLWNIQDDEAAQAFFKVQHIAATGPFVVETIVGGGVQFITVAVADHSTLGSAAALIFEWKGGHMDEFAVFPKLNLVRLVPFCIFSRVFLFLASSTDEEGDPVTEADILLYNLHLHKFEHFQTLPSSGAVDVGVFSFGSGVDFETYLLIANTYDERGVTPKSYIYKYNSDRFRAFQCMDIADIRGWYPIQDNKFLISLIIYTSTDIKFYEYDGWSFQESQLQFDSDSIATPVNALSVQYHNYHADVVIASFTEQNETIINLFEVEFIPLNVVENFYNDSESQCDASGTIYENIVTKHVTIETKLPNVIYKDLGNFEFSGNVSFLEDIDASNIVLNDIVLEGSYVLTNEEQAQLDELIATKNRNALALTTMETELPDTMLLVTTPQSVAGLKTFSSFDADGDVPSTTLSVTTDLVNTNVNIINLNTEMIDTTADETISVPMSISGGIDITGTLTTTGTVDGVDMTEIVTLSGDHTITGVKTFTALVTASGDIDVSGTVDGVIVTTSSVFLNTGAQTVSGSYTISGGLTANEDVVVTGTVDGVDLSTLQDEAVYLDGDHDIAGAMTLSGPVTMETGLSVADGSTVDGVDIEDLDSGLFRLTVNQDVSANHTYTSVMTVDGDITVTGTVDLLTIPDDVVLVDDPNPVSMQGPLQFSENLTVSGLCIQSYLNHISTIEEYESLDLLLTAPRTPKNRQTVTGVITFASDIYLLNTSMVSGRVDGIDLQQLEGDTVFITGDQTITGVKTFTSDMVMSGDLTVGQTIDGVNINHLDDNAIKLSDGSINAAGSIKFAGDVEFQDAITTGGMHTFGTSTTLSDLVTQGTTETIAGAKTFTSITSNDDIQVTSTIDGVPIDTLYSDAIRLADSSAVTVTGDWSFSNDVGVGGDLDVSGDIDGIDLDNAVTITGDQTITGPTSFSADVSATVSISVDGNLVIGDVNGEDVGTVDGDTLKCSGAQTVTGRKTFDTLTVDSNLVITGTISGEDVSDINDNVVFDNGDQQIGGTKTFPAQTTFTNVVFGVVDGIQVPAYFSTVLTQDTTQTVLVPVATVDVVVDADILVTGSVNGLVVQDMWAYSAKLTDDTYTVEIVFSAVESEDDITVAGSVDGIVISRDVALADENLVFSGKKTFSAGPSFGSDVNVVLVNDVNILDLWQRVVTTTGAQDITAGKTFSSGTTLNGDLAVTGTVDGVDVSDFAARAVVTSDVGGAVQTITAPVTLSTVTAEQDVAYTGLLQTVNIQSLESSYFSRTAQSQTITGDKLYSGAVGVLSGGSLSVTSLTLLGVFNTHDLDTLYSEVWMVDGVDTVYGVKTFTQCVTIQGNLQVDGTVDGVDISSNVMVTNTDQLVTGFKVFSSDLAIDGQNLNFEADVNIDEVDVSAWSLSAALKSSTYTIPTHVTFASIVFDGSVVVSGQCSGLDFSPATFMTISRDQTVTAAKTFQNGVEFAGNMDVTGTVQGADVVVIQTTSLLVSGAQTLTDPLTLQSSPTFSDITTSALIDGEDVVELYLLTHNTPDLDDFDEFLDGQCDLLDDMHDAFQNQAYILRYPELVQTIETNGLGKFKGYYFDGIQWLIQARTQYSIDVADDECIDSFIYQWSDVDGRYNLFKDLTLDYAQDATFFEEDGYLFLAVITSASTKSCEEIDFLASDEDPSRDESFELDVIPDDFEGISDVFILIYVWSPGVNEFLVYQRLAGVGSVSVDTYVDPALNRSCLAIANHRIMNEFQVTSAVKSAVYCMGSVEEGFNHHASIDTLGAVKILPFIFDGVLHLAVANRLDTAERTFLVESAIWGDFEKEAVITTSAAADVAVKEFHGYFFVAFANEFEGLPDWEDYDVPISIYTYEYGGDGESLIELKQELPAFRVQSLEFVEIHDQLFLVVVNKTNSVAIFRYEGMEMFQVIHTIPLEGAMNLAIYPFKNDPKNVHIATMAYATSASFFSSTPIETRPVDSVILKLYFQGFDTDTIGCSSP